MKKRPVSERSMIGDIRARAQVAAGSRTRNITLGIGDDCALIRPAAGEEIAITTDFSLENVHFRRDWHPAQSAGHRCLARGLSDLAAMGARPVGVLLSLALPAELAVPVGGGRSWVDRFLDGFLALAAAHQVPLIGGDTAQSPGSAGLASMDVVLLGGVKRGRALRRSGAKAGDLIYVTGALGGAAAELLALQRDPGAFSQITTVPKSGLKGTHPHLYPLTRVAVGRRLLGLATSAIDLSDGLSTDLRHICDESHLAAEIYDLPIHPLALVAEATGLTLSALSLALDGGEDYELLFTASPRTKIPAKIAGVPIHAIGEMKPRRGGRPVVRLRVEGAASTAGEKGRSRLVPIEPGGWEHFREP